MPAIEVETVIAASPMAVSDALLDIDLAPLWTSGLEGFELIEGEIGQPGCVGRAHYFENGRRSTLEDRLLEATPGRSFRSELTGEGLRARVETDLAEVPGGTRMTIRWSGTGTNPLTRLLLPLLKTRLRKRSQQDLETLKRLIESDGATA
jgi:uncharacterized protein YndB with AHSA1/START domain